MTELIVDSFAGGGGASIGIERALGRPVDIAVNHDADAIAVHELNHPRTRHYQEDVWKLNLRGLVDGQPVGLLWASPDCKHFSKAKGGKPVSKRVRGLAWVVLRWIAQVRPRRIILENVEEFADWGPLGKDGKPCPRRKKKTFNSFVRQIRGHGYKVEHRELVASHYGAPTSRKRFFLVARCDGLPIRWPERTHGAPESPEVLAGELLPYRTAAECIDWSLPCPSIFLTQEEAKTWWRETRPAGFDQPPRRPLKPATLRRIATGVQRYVIEAAEPFLVHTTHGGTRAPRGLGAPLPTITGANRGEMALAIPTLIQTGHGERKGQAPRVPGLEKPLGTVVACGQRHGLVAAFLAKHNGGVIGQGLRDSMATIVGRDQKALVASSLVHLRNNCDGRSLADPAPTLTAGAGHVGEVRAFLTTYNGQSLGQQVQDPLATVPATDRFGLVYVHGEPYAIADIGMRMLQPHELAAAQGFPEGYILAPPERKRTKGLKVRMVGNSVPPDLSCAMVEANCGDMMVSRGQLGLFGEAA